MTHRAILLVLGVIAFFVSGCAGMRDVTADVRYHGDYRVGAIYKTKTLLFVRRDGTVWRPNFGGSPPSIEALHTNKIGTWSDTAGALLPGTELRPDHVEVNRFGGTVGRIVHVQASILDGDLAGTRANLMTVSGSEYSRELGVSMPMVSRDLLDVSK